MEPEGLGGGSWWRRRRLGVNWEFRNTAFFILTNVRLKAPNLLSHSQSFSFSFSTSSFHLTPLSLSIFFFLKLSRTHARMHTSIHSWEPMHIACLKSTYPAKKKTLSSPTPPACHSLGFRRASHIYAHINESCYYFQTWMCEYMCTYLRNGKFGNVLQKYKDWMDEKFNFFFSFNPFIIIFALCRHIY